MPVLYGEIQKDGTLLEREDPHAEEAKTPSPVNPDFKNGFFSQTSLVQCVRYKLSIVLNVPISEKEQKEVGLRCRVTEGQH